MPAAEAAQDDASHCDVIASHPGHLLLGSISKFVFYQCYLPPQALVVCVIL